MPDRFVESHIKRLKLFERLNDIQLDLIVDNFRVLRFEPGAIVFREGTITQGLYVIVAGSAALYRKQPDGSQRAIGTVGEGEVIDRGALFEEGAETVTLQITQPAVVLFLSRKRMNSVLAHYPEIRAQLGASDVGTKAPPPRPINPHAIRQRRAEDSFRRENEEVILTRRRHPWAFIRRGWLSVMIFVLFAAGGLSVFAVQRLLGVGIVGTGFVLSGLLMTYFYFEWRNDSFIVTSQRVIRIERVIHTLSVNISEIPLDNIQAIDASLPEGDLFARIFDYGDLELMNASDGGDLVLDMIPNPEEVQELIFSKRKTEDVEDEQMRRNAIRAELERRMQFETGVHPQVDPRAAGAPVPQAPQAADPTPPTPSPVPGDRWDSISPARMRFTNDNGDTVIRKHVTIWLQAVFAPSVMLFGGFVIMAVSLLSGGAVNLFGVSLTAVGLPMALLFFVIGGLWFWWSDWDWRNDMYIISDDQVTLIHKRPLWLQNETDQVLLSRVDNVVSETKGLFDTLFQRGDVRISLIGEGIEGAKVFQHVHRPHDVQAELSRRRARAKETAEREEELKRREEIADYLEVYHEAREQQIPGQFDGEPYPPNYPPQGASPNPPTNPNSGYVSNPTTPVQRNTGSARFGPYDPNDLERPPRVPRRGETYDPPNDPPQPPPYQGFRGG